MKTILLFALITMSSTSWSQTDSTRIAEVRAVIDQLFEGMRTGDSTLVREVFHENAELYTTYKKDDAFQLSMGSIDEFAKAVGTPHDEVWDERISNMVIQVDDGLASAWMEYSFYVGDKFSHKGVNSMVLVDGERGWKIINIADTRRRN
ncbi:MAG: nuclear transport factor 2 family protein [Crocinitomicaceae bacterium]|nr:nuclear transport factor 2 family protein [Crocinitomicaceae bacterium]